MAYASMEYVPLAHNFALNLKKVGVENYVVLVTSDEALLLLQEHNLNVYNVADLTDLPPRYRLPDTPRPLIGGLETIFGGARWPHWFLRLVSLSSLYFLEFLPY